VKPLLLRNKLKKYPNVYLNPTYKLIGGDAPGAISFKERGFDYLRSLLVNI
jgi:hypothetical protein